MAFPPQPLFNWLTESILRHVYQRVRLPLTPSRKRLRMSQNHSPSSERSLWLVYWRTLCPRRARINVLLRFAFLFFPFFSRLPLIRCSVAPIAWPIAKLLDHVLGKSDLHTYKKAELKSFLQFHRTGEEPLRDDEISILNGVLELNTRKVETIMTPMQVRRRRQPRF